MLPDIDGIAVMRQLRDGGVAAPFLIITALGEVDAPLKVTWALALNWKSLELIVVGPFITGSV
jgi:DNA-binding response OmpR family regulator